MERSGASTGSQDEAAALAAVGAILDAAQAAAKEDKAKSKLLIARQKAKSATKTVNPMTSLQVARAADRESWAIIRVLQDKTVSIADKVKAVCSASVARVGRPMLFVAVLDASGSMGPTWPQLVSAMAGFIAEVAAHSPGA